jgi:RimJ/RimL family protein N-acetyltransferase
MRNAVIASDRLYLRLIERDDAAFMVETFAGETETAYGHGRMPTSALALERFIEERTRHVPPEELPFGLCRRSDDALIGIFSLRDIDWVNRTAETGSGLFHAADRGHGIGTEAKHLLLAYAFDVLHLHAVRSHVAGWNARSAAALRKQGYRLAGHELCDEFHDGAYHDGTVWVLIARDWRALRAT